MNERAKESTMYERFGAVAELNKVPGFDPLRFARRVAQNGGEKLLLDLKYKKLWFRLRYPQGRIKVTPLKITEQLAIIEAKVFFDRGDTVPAASFIAQRYAKDTPGGLYIESAQHMAADTALDDAGFGVQLMSAKEERPAQAAAAMKTAPVEMPVAASAPPIAAETIAPAVQEQRLTREMPQAAPAEEPPAPSAEPVSMAETVMPMAPASSEEVTPADLSAAQASTEQAPTMEPVEAAAAEQPPVVEPAAVDAATGEVRYTAATPVDDICSLMTLDDARNIIVDTGTCKGQTLAWVSERRAASLKWYLNGYQGDNNMLRAGAKLLLAEMAMDKAS